MPTTTIGYFGLGHMHTPAYLESFQELPVELTCAYQSDPPFEGDSPTLEDVRVFRDPEALLANESIDVAWIAASNAETPRLVELAAEAGADIYAEKPAAKTASDLDGAIEAVESADVTAAVGYQNRAHPAARELRQRASTGFFGTLQAAELRMLTSQLRYRNRLDDAYSRDASRGGILQWLGCHLIDLVSWILNERIVRVSARTIRSNEPAVDVEAGATVSFELASGAIGSLTAGYYRREYDTTVALYGMDGQAVWEPTARDAANRNELELVATGNEWQSAPKRTITYEFEDAPGYGGTIGLDYFGQFFDARETGVENKIVASLDDAADVLRVLDASYESASTGQWVEVARPEQNGE